MTAIRLATRRSDLALRQAESVRAALLDRRHEVELIEVETTGDRVRDELIHRLGKTGAFVRSLDELVLAGEVDGAVHSMKDVPTESPEELIVAATPRRANPKDVLVTPDGKTLEELPDGATVGTSSLRRTAQLLRRRPDLSVTPLRGNVDTRLEKLLAPHLQREHERRLEAEEAGRLEAEEAGRLEAEEADRSGENGGGDDDEDESVAFDRSAEEWFEDRSEIERQALGRSVDVEFDAIVLAAAGLERSGLTRQVNTRPLPVAEHVPAPGQGALAVTTRDTELAATIHDILDHPPTRVATTVERAVLGELGGGCVAPIGVHARVQGQHVRTWVQVLDRGGEDVISVTRDLSIEKHLEDARELAADLAERGAREVIERARDAEIGEAREE